jgi:hypothetical protein
LGAEVDSLPGRNVYSDRFDVPRIQWERIRPVSAGGR